MSEVIEKPIFKIQGVGIDLTNVSYSPSYLEGITSDLYFFTNPGSNNDYVVSDFVKSHPECPLITSIDFLDEYLLREHLNILGRDKTDLLLINSSCDILGEIDLVKELSLLVTDNNVGIKFIGSTSTEHLEEIKSVVDFKYLMLDFCPLNFNYSVIKWCESNNVKIIGSNPFGGKLSSQVVIDAFTVPYLLNFSSNYSELVVLSGRDLYYLGEEVRYLVNLIGTESSPRYILKKSVNKLVKPLKKMVGVSIKVDDNTIIPYDYPEMIYSEADLDISLGAATLKISDSISNEEEEIREYIDSLQIPINIDDKNLLSLVRYRILEYMKANFIESNISLCRAGNTEVIIKVENKNIPEKKAFWNFFKSEGDKKSKLIDRSYMLSVYNGNIVFVDTTSENA